MQNMIHLPLRYCTLAAVLPICPSPCDMSRGMLRANDDKELVSIPAGKQFDKLP